MKLSLRNARLGIVIATLAMPAAGALSALGGDDWKLVSIDEYRINGESMCKIRDAWIQDILAHNAAGTWVEMRMELNNEQLGLMGLPTKEVLLANRYPVPTAVFPDGHTETVALDPALAAYAGNGCLGIRPGAFLLLINDGSVGWCSMAHVYGAPGNYKISTAGHCGKSNDWGTVIAGVGNFNRDFGIGPAIPAPILLDFGKFSSSTDGGIGNDNALISVTSTYQNLVSPTMCFWAGPRGYFTTVGATATAQVITNSGHIEPSASTDTNPFLQQAILHYGHGTGGGTGGTPRAAYGFHWAADHFSFFGEITPGDSGSGANTAGGDAVGEVNEAAGIITHLYVDPSLETGLGLMAGTRAMRVSTGLAIGQLVPYPVPAPGLP